MKLVLRVFFCMMLLTGIIYPLLITGLSQIFMPHLAGGSLIQKNGRILGSKLIAQKTTKERFFLPRPSAIDYNPLHPSGGSNLGPISQKLKETVYERQKKWGTNVPSQLLYASGSGLDPHISLESAYFQIPRVAKENETSESAIRQLVDSLADGSCYINVLILNQALDEQSQR